MQFATMPTLPEIVAQAKQEVVRQAKGQGYHDLTPEDVVVFSGMHFY
jgi:hypothetical protein